MGLSDYAYMLRYCLAPGHRTEERLAHLVSVCREGQVDDVMFFINAEELNNGHLTIEETQTWLDTIVVARERLAPLGVTVSINPWTTLLHATRGRKLRGGQRFRLMTDRRGVSSSVVACPICPEWQRYIEEIYANYASIRPAFLWLEDDFRFHNHEPLEWGGCFCEEHMREFAARAGEPSLDRETFVRGMLQPGDPHRYRRIWLDYCRETLVALADRIASAVHRVSPETRIGLMTSDPKVHAAEGRDWHGIFAALDGDGGRTAINRAHLPAYREEAGPKYWWLFNGISRLTAALLPEATEVYPELENYPYSRYSKSFKFTRFQFDTSIVLGSRGITLDMSDMMGNGLFPVEPYGRMLRDAKSFLNAGAGLRLRVRDQRGVQVLVDERSSYTVRTSLGDRMEELYPSETLWASYLSACGIANRYAIGAPDDEEVVAVSGQYFRGRSETEIRELFAKHVVLLDGEAAYTLCDMGLGDVCGIERAKWHHCESGFHSYEQINGDGVYAGLAGGRMTAQIAIGDYVEIAYGEGAEPLSTVYGPAGSAVGPGMTVLNGRVYVLPYGRVDSDFHQGLLNPIRRAVLQETLHRLTKEAPVMVGSYSPHVSVYAFESDEDRALVLVNASSDDADDVELAVGERFGGGGRWTEISREAPDGRPVDAELREGKLLAAARLSSLTVKVLRQKKANGER